MSNVIVNKEWLENGLESICDGIRAKTGEEGALAFPEGMRTAVDSIQQGSKYEEFYANVTANDTNLAYLYALKGAGLTEFPTYHDYSKVTNMIATFYSTDITSIPELYLPEVTTLGQQGSAGSYGAFQLCKYLRGDVKIHCPKCEQFGYVFNGAGQSAGINRLDIDTSNGTYFYSFLYNCKVNTIGTLDMRKATEYMYWLRACTAETVEKLIINTNPFGNVNNASNCSKLANLTIEGTLGSSSHVYLASMPLTAESVKSIINAVEDISGTAKEGTLSIKLSSVAVSNIEADGATAPNGDTWLNYLLAKGWTY